MKKLAIGKKIKLKALNLNCSSSQSEVLKTAPSPTASGEKAGIRRPRIRFMPVLSMMVLSVSSGLIFTAPAFPEIKTLKGQTLYVPVYSHIYHGNRDKEPVDLTATLSIRNTDFVNAINITSIDYYDSDGVLVKKHLDKTLTIKPLGSTRVIVKESDKSGGSGAKFIVKWEASVKMTEPVVETIMIGTQAQQGISFTSRAQALKETE